MQKLTIGFQMKQQKKHQFSEKEKQEIKKSSAARKYRTELDPFMLKDDKKENDNNDNNDNDKKKEKEKQ